MSDSTGDVTGILRRWSEGDTSGRDELIEQVYAELKRVARVPAVSRTGQSHTATHRPGQ